MPPEIMHLFQDFAEAFFRVTGHYPAFSSGPFRLEDREQIVHESGNERQSPLRLTPLLIRKEPDAYECLVPFSIQEDAIGHFRIQNAANTTDLESGLQKFEAAGKLLAYFSEFLGHYAEANALDLRSNLPAHVRSALRIIRSRSHQELTLDSLAADVGVSPNYLSSQLTKHTGKSFNRHLTERRITHAKRLLESVNHQIAEVAYSVGFRSVSQFNRSFRTIMGTSPSEFRKSLRPEPNGEAA